MRNLNRIQVGDFNIQESITIDELKKGNTGSIISIEDFFKENEKIILSLKDVKYFINGVKLSRNLKDGLYSIYNENNNFIGIGVVIDNKLKRDIVINK